MRNKPAEEGDVKPLPGGRREERAARRRFGTQRHCVFPVCCCQTTISYVTLRLSARLYDEGHNGFTHSQCTSLQSKVGGTLYKKKMADSIDLPNPQQGLWLDKEHLQSVLYARCIKRNL